MLRIYIIKNKMLSTNTYDFNFLSNMYEIRKKLKKKFRIDFKFY